MVKRNADTLPPPFANGPRRRGARNRRHRRFA